MGGGIGLLSLTSCSKNIDVPLKVEDYLKDHKHLLPAPIGVNPGDWDTVTNTNMLAYFNTNLDVQNLFNGILNEQYVENDDFFKQDFFKVNKFNINDNDEQPCNKSITISGKLTKDDPDGKNGFAGDKFNRFQSCGFNNASYYWKNSYTLESETNNDDGGPALLTSVGVDNDSQCILLIFEDSNKSDFITLWSEEMVNIIPLIPTY